MSVPDPARIEKILADFHPKRKPAFVALQPYKGLIAGLRAKGASYDTIAEILEQEGVRTSDTTVRKFCREVMLEIHPGKSKRRRSSPGGDRSAGQVERSSTFVASPPASTVSVQATPLTTVPLPRERTPGPRVAKVEFLEEPKI